MLQPFPLCVSSISILYCKCTWVPAMPVIVLQASKQAVPDAQTNGWKKLPSGPQPQSPSSPSKPARPTTTPEQTPSPKARASASTAQPEQHMTTPAAKPSTTPASAQKRLPSSPNSQQSKVSPSLERAEQKSISDAAHAGPVVYSPAPAEDKSPSPSKPATAAADEGESIVCLNCRTKVVTLQCAVGKCFASGCKLT